MRRHREIHVCAKCGEMVKEPWQLKARALQPNGTPRLAMQMARFTEFSLCDRCWFELSESLPYAKPREGVVEI